MLITCKECNHEISSNARACPNCGASRKEASRVFMKYLAVPLIAGGAILFFLFASAMNG